MAVTIYDIAQAAGVDEATVRRALSGKGRINIDTKARIVKLAQEMRYRPNEIARSLVLGQSTFIALIDLPIDLPGYARIIGNLTRALSIRGYTPLHHISMHQDGPGLHFGDLIQKRIAGAIAVPSSLLSDPAPYRELIDAGIKLVLMDKTIEGMAVPQIIANQYQSGRLATEHLISLGHRDIVLLAIPQESYIGRERTRGFVEAMESAGIPVTPESIVVTDYTDASGQEVVTRLLERKNRPTAFVARHDFVAVGAMRAVFAAGLSVPEDVSIVSHGDLWPVDMLRAPLTTIHYPSEEMVSLAVERLLQMLDGEIVDPRTEMLDVSLVVRSSTASLRR